MFNAIGPNQMPSHEMVREFERLRLSGNVDNSAHGMNYPLDFASATMSPRQPILNMPPNPPLQGLFNSQPQPPQQSGNQFLISLLNKPQQPPPKPPAVKSSLSVAASEFVPTFRRPEKNIVLYSYENFKKKSRGDDELAINDVNILVFHYSIKEIDGSYLLLLN